MVREFNRVGEIFKANYIVSKLLEGKPLLSTPEELAVFKQYVLSKEMYVGWSTRRARPR